MGAVWGVINDLTEWLKDFSGNWWFLAIILIIALLDSVIPVVPSETTVIIGGVAASAAGDGPFPLYLVIAAGIVGAFLGDNISFEIGHRASHMVERKAARKESTAKKLKWASDQIEERGGLLLITARFIPGGRTILTLSCGFTHQPRRWFAGWVIVAVTIWATYAAVLGYTFGSQFEDDHTLAFLLAFGAALTITVVIEIIRYARKKMTTSALEKTAV